MRAKESDSESDEGPIAIGDRTAVDILRAPLELPPPTRRPPTMKHPVLKAPRKTSKYKGEGDFSPLFWKVVREMRLEDEARRITITELPLTPRDDNDLSSPQLLYRDIPKLTYSEYSSDSEISSDGNYASGETSGSEKEDETIKQQDDNGDDVEYQDERSESPMKRAIFEDRSNNKNNYDDSSDGEFD